MTIEQELQEALTDGFRAHTALHYHDVALDLYGFRGDPFLTLEACGGPRNLTRERIRQIRNQVLRKSGLVAVPGLRRALSILGERSVWPVSDFRDRLFNEGVIGPDAAAEGVIALLQSLGEATDIAMYDQWLRRLLRPNWLESMDSIIMRPDLADRVHEHLKAARSFPGVIGIAGLEDFVTTRTDIDDEQVGLLRYLLAIDPNTWITEHEGRTCYLVEDRDNRLLSFSEKVFRNDGWIRASVLAEIYRNALTSKPETYRFPDAGLIEGWLRSSQWFETSGDLVRYRGVGRSRAARNGHLMRSIDRDMVAYLRERPYGEFAAMRQHLEAVGHGPDTVKSSISRSTLVHVDRSRGRMNYRYTLVDHLMEGAEAVEEAAVSAPTSAAGDASDAATDADTDGTARCEERTLKD